MNLKINPQETTTWTPRERVHLMYLLAPRATREPKVATALTEIRELLVGAECKA